MMGMPPTNKSFNIEGVDIIVLKDGKLLTVGAISNQKIMRQARLDTP